jgi:hypothetical protein
MTDHYTLYGALGSTCSMKMRALIIPILEYQVKCRAEAGCLAPLETA